MEASDTFILFILEHSFFLSNHQVVSLDSLGNLIPLMYLENLSLLALQALEGAISILSRNAIY